MAKRKSFKRYQRARRQEWLSDTLTEVAVLEGRLMAALDLDLQQVADRVYGQDYLTPCQKRDALLSMAAEVGV